ncbi:unnamed protein product, partial [Amoebophrya sp. A25]
DQQGDEDAPESSREEIYLSEGAVDCRFNSKEVEMDTTSMDLPTITHDTLKRSASSSSSSDHEGNYLTPSSLTPTEVRLGSDLQQQAIAGLTALLAKTSRIAAEQDSASDGTSSSSRPRIG